MSQPDAKIQQDGGDKSEYDLRCHNLHREAAAWPKQLVQASYESLDVIGDPKILSGSLLAVFCSSKCTGDAILKSTKWICQLSEDESRTVIGGFHSAMEKSLLEILLAGQCPLIVCPARSLKHYRMPKKFERAVESGRLAVISTLPPSVRTNTGSSSRKRNQLVSDLAGQIVVTYASAQSRTEQFALELLRSGRTVLCLDTGCESLIAAGAEILAPEVAHGRKRE